MIVYAIDPGNEISALVAFNATTRRILEKFTAANESVMAYLHTEARDNHVERNPLVIEEFESFGMAVGREVFRTVWWSGRFYEIWHGPKHMLPRRNVKSHICHNTRATDANIRQAIYDLFGGKLAAVGKSKAPGPLFGVKGHEYAALALAITFAETHADGE